jgi:NAD-dependent dihydropyrimidine dehydrogenase PreA subunit
MALAYIKNVTTLFYNAEKCVGCGKCAEVCPHGVFEMDGRKSRLIEKDSCMECGACALNCQAQAILVNPGVGCAEAIINGWLTGKEPNCDCSGTGGSGCC